MEGKRNIHNVEGPPRKSKNRWDIITENKLEAMIRIRDEGQQYRDVTERDFRKYGDRRWIGFI
jgi:hypothetical protein